MTGLREAAQQALEVLQAYGSHVPNCDHLVLLTSLPPQRKPCSCGLSANITALKAALAEPEQGPLIGRAATDVPVPVYVVKKAKPVQEPVAGSWSVFNTGAEVFSGMSLPEAVAELTPARLERGWSAVCVINKDNPPTYAPPQRKPLTEEEALDIARTFGAQPWPPGSCVEFARAIEAAHGIKEGT